MDANVEEMDWSVSGWISAPCHMALEDRVGFVIRTFSGILAHPTSREGEHIMAYVNSTLLEAWLAKEVMGAAHHLERDSLEARLIQSSTHEFLDLLRGMLASGEEILLTVVLDGECTATKDGLRLVVELERCMRRIEDEKPLRLAQLIVFTIGEVDAVPISIGDAVVRIDIAEEPHPVAFDRILGAQDGGWITQLAQQAGSVIMAKGGSKSCILSCLPLAATRQLHGLLQSAASLMSGRSVQLLELTGRPWSTRDELSGIDEMRNSAQHHWIIWLDPEQLRVCLPLTASLDIILLWDGVSDMLHRVQVAARAYRVYKVPFEATQAAHLRGLRYKWGTQAGAAKNAVTVLARLGGKADAVDPETLAPSLHQHVDWAAYFMAIPGLAKEPGLLTTYFVQSGANRVNLTSALEYARIMGVVHPTDSDHVDASPGLWDLENALLTAGIDRDYSFQAAAMWAAPQAQGEEIQRRVLIRMGAILAAGFPNGASTLHLLENADVFAMRTLFTGLAKRWGATGYLWTMLGLWEYFKNSQHSFNINLQATVNGKGFVVDKAWGQAVERYVAAVEGYYKLAPAGPGWMDAPLSMAHGRLAIDKAVAQCLAQNCVILSSDGTVLALYGSFLAKPGQPYFVDASAPFDKGPFSPDGEHYAAVAAEMMTEDDGNGKQVTTARYLTLIRREHAFALRDGNCEALG